MLKIIYKKAKHPGLDIACEPIDKLIFFFFATFSSPNAESKPADTITRSGQN